METLAVDIVSIRSLTLDASNPRRIASTEKAKLRQSIREFGMVQPIVVRRSDRMVIGGHQRLQAAIEEGWTEVPVIWWEGPDKQARALNLALNRISGEWDEKKLAEVLLELAEVESLSDALLGFDTTLTDLAGFDSREVLQAIEVARPSGLEEEDLSRLAAALLSNRTATKAKPGDLFSLGPHRLLCGDSRDLDQLKRLCAADKVDLLFTDPPYGVRYSPESVGNVAASGRGTGRKRRPLGPIAEDDLNAEDHASLITTVLRNAAAVSSPGTPVYVCGGTSTTSIYDAAFQDADLLKSSIIVWDKGSFSFGRKDYQSQFEFIYYGWRRGGRHHFFGGRSQTDIWFIPRDPSLNYVHPTQKPVALARRAIRNSSTAGDNVLDLFAGSGSTLIACELEGRRALLMDLDTHYVDVIVARWEAFTGKKAQLLQEQAHA